MKKILILVLIAIILCPAPALSKDLEFFDNTDNKSNGNGKIQIIKLNVSTNNNINEKALLKNSWDFIKGKAGDNSANLLMFSYHTRKDRALLNDSNKLLAVDYNGYCLGTYYNSYHAQTYYAGISRKLFEKDLIEGINMDVKYKLMVLRGYKNYEFNINGFTPLIVPMIGFSKGLVGVDFLISPGKTLTFATTFRINLPDNKAQ